MKSEDITAIATTVIAINLLIGTVFYFQKELENKRLIEEKIQQMELKKKEKLIKNEEKKWNELYKEEKDKKGLKKIWQKYKSDRKNCKTSFSDYEEYFECMSEKGYREKFIRNFNKI